MGESWGENKIESLSEIVRKVNNFLNPILEEKFDLQTRQRYMIGNILDYAGKQKKIEKTAENLKISIDNDTLVEEMREAKNDYENTKKIIEDTKPEGGISLDLANDLRKIDKDGKLEKDLSRVYGFKEKMNSWEDFLMLLNVALPNDPTFWDERKDNSRLNK